MKDIHDDRTIDMFENVPVDTIPPIFRSAWQDLSVASRVTFKGTSTKTEKIFFPWLPW